MESHIYNDGYIPLLREYSSYLNTKSYYYSPSYTALWCLRDDTHIYEGEYGIYIYRKASNSFFLPMAKEMDKAIKELEGIAREENIPLAVKSITEEYLPFFEDRFSLERDRNLDEYIYLKDKLVALSGKHLQSKRNHISQFRKAYPEYKSEPLAKDDKEEVLAFTASWIDTMPDYMRMQLENEYITIEKAFEHWELFDFHGAIIRVDGKIIAYTIAEKQDDTIVVHYEKADTSFHGAYAMINNEFLSKYAPDAIFINRMDDDGIEGLRKAKESYKPEKMIEKWCATLK